jgi:hypothetical protein
MAISSVFRYRTVKTELVGISSAVPGPIVIGPSTLPVILQDITAPTASREDLDAYMTSQGFVFDSVDPVSTVAEEGQVKNAPGHLTKDISGGGVFVLSRSEYSHEFLVFTGVMLINADIEFPALDGIMWVVKNNGTMAVSLKVVGSLLASIVVLAGGSVLVWSDGVNLNLIP